MYLIRLVRVGRLRLHIVGITYDIVYQLFTNWTTLAISLSRLYFGTALGPFVPRAVFIFTQPRPPAPPSMLIQSLFPKDTTGSDILKLKVLLQVLHKLVVKVKWIIQCHHTNLNQSSPMLGGNARSGAGAPREPVDGGYVGGG